MSDAARGLIFYSRRFLASSELLAAPCYCRRSLPLLFNHCAQSAISVRRRRLYSWNTADPSRALAGASAAVLDHPTSILRRDRGVGVRRCCSGAASESTRARRHGAGRHDGRGPRWHSSRVTAKGCRRSFAPAAAASPASPPRNAEAGGGTRSSPLATTDARRCVTEGNVN